MFESAVLQAKMGSSRRSRNWQGAEELLPMGKAGVGHRCSTGQSAKMLWFQLKEQIWPGTNMAHKVDFAPPKPTLQISFERDFCFRQKMAGWGIAERLNMCYYC